MTDSITDFKCDQCGAFYNSEDDLEEHLKAAHHQEVCDRQPKISYETVR
jgi:C2H2-type zinc finger